MLNNMTHCSKQFGLQLLFTFIGLSLLMLTGTANAQSKYSAPSSMDTNFLERQFNSINDIAKLELGRELRRTESDLDILQIILDRNLVEKDDQLKLQAMGTVMGELFKAKLGLDWVILEDAYGRTRALRLDDTEHLLFPNTMISRRVKVDLEVNIREMYQRNYDYIYKLKSNPHLQKKSSGF